LTIKIMRLDVQLDDQYCRREDGVFVMIFVIKLIKVNERRPELKGMIPS